MTGGYSGPSARAEPRGRVSSAGDRVRRSGNSGPRCRGRRGVAGRDLAEAAPPPRPSARTVGSSPRCRGALDRRPGTAGRASTPRRSRAAAGVRALGLLPVGRPRASRSAQSGCGGSSARTPRGAALPRSPSSSAGDPGVDEASVSDATRAGWSSASSWPIAPPTDMPTTCARREPERVDQADRVARRGRAARTAAHPARR